MTEAGRFTEQCRYHRSGDATLVERWLYLAVDGELSEDRARELEQCLDQCAECRALEARIRKNASALEEEVGQISGVLERLIDDDAWADRAILGYEERREADAERRANRFQRIGLVAVLAVGVVSIVVAAAWERITRAPESRPVAVVEWTGPPPHIERIDGRGDAVPGDRLYASDEVHVPEGTSVHVRLVGTRDGIEVALGSQIHATGPARFRLRGDSTTDVVDLFDGAALVEVDDRARELRVKTEVGVIAVDSTRFRIEHDPGGPETRLEMFSGTTRVWRRDRPATAVTVSAGFGARVTPRLIQVLPPPRRVQGGALEEDSVSDERVGQPDETDDHEAGTRGGDEGSRKVESDTPRSELPTSRSRGLDLPRLFQWPEPSSAPPTQPPETGGRLGRGSR